MPFLDFDGVLNSRDQPDDDPVHRFTQVLFLAARLPAWPGDGLNPVNSTISGIPSKATCPSISICKSMHWTRAR